MKVQRKITSTTIVEVEGDTLTEVFEQLAALEEIFGGPNACGRCKKTDLRHQVRTVDKNKFYELVCLSCRSTFRFGVRREPVGAMFPQLKDPKTDRPKPDGGWDPPYK